jgi:tetratricopeptide (TPR) repeat protein/serine/threonine protein kinase
MNDNEESIFAQALETRDPRERGAFLDRACAGNPSLRQGVESLLAGYEAGSFLEAPAPALGATIDEPVTECPGTVIGPYKLVEQIGEGGFGVVFVAEQQRPVRRKVALKVIKPGMDSRQVVARFEAERQALALTDHPNIARVLDGGQTGSGRPYFVMDLVKGLPITDYCDQAQLSPRERLGLFIQVCQAVQHAHQKGIIHRDLKPSNVLVALHDGRPLVKVIDFGIAKALGQQLTDKTLFTGFAQLIGTPLYMSPEQAALSNADVDTRSDVYSLGVLLYELLTGTTPFEKERLREVGFDEMRRIIREEEPPKPSTRMSTLGQAATTLSANRRSDPKRLSRLFRVELDWVVMKALEKDRNRRYETASALAADVERYLHDESVLACPPSPLYRFRKFARRNRGTLVVAAGVFVAVMMIVATIGWAVRDREVREGEIERVEITRRAGVASEVRQSFNVARALTAANKLAAARHKLDEAKAQLGQDRAALSALADQVEAGEAELDRFQRFLDVMERANQGRTGLPETALAETGAAGRVETLAAGRNARRRPTWSALVHQALQQYEVLTSNDWSATLEGDLLGTDQAEQIRRTVYEELLRLAWQLLSRTERQRAQQKLSPKAAAQQALVYLGKAESAQGPTQVFYMLRARCRQALGDRAGAQADRQRADQTAPTTAQDHALRGVIAIDEGRLSEAIGAFEAAVRLEPSRYWPLMGLGIALCDLGRSPEEIGRAAGIFTGCLLTQPNDSLAYAWRAIAYAKLGCYQKALADCAKAIALDPELASAWDTRGNIRCDALAQYDKALADLSKAIELDPKSASHWNNRGVAHRKAGQPAKALADFSKAIELDPTLALAWHGRGFTYYTLGRAAEAIRGFSKAIELDPKLALAWVNRGAIYAKLGQWDKAVRDCSKAIELDPKLADAWGNRGATYLVLGQPAKAVADLCKAIELDPKCAEAWSNRAEAYARLGQWDRAAADVARAIELDSKLAHAWSTRGAIYCEHLAQYDRAIADLSKAIELDSKLVNAWNYRGTIYCDHLAQYHKALADFSKAIELNPNDANPWYNRGNAYSKLGQLDRAAGDFSKAIELNPKFPGAWSNRGAAHLRLGQLDKAVADFSKAIELDPTGPGPWYNRALAYFRLAQFEQAVEDLSKFVRLAPDQPRLAETYLMRARAYYRLASVARAREDCEFSLSRARANPGTLFELGWLLATCPEIHLRDPHQVVELARRGVEMAPAAPVCWCTLGLAHYRAGDWTGAVAALAKSVELHKGQGLFDRLFLAMAHRRLGNREQARKAYDLALQWLENNKAALGTNKLLAQELGRIRSEAEEVLGLKQK